MVISSPCLTNIKNWLVQSKRLLLASPKQKALALAIPEQTATGKETSNLFMAGSLPKTTRLEAKEFQVYKVTKELKLIKEQIKELQCVWIHPPGVQEAQTKET
ncbi:hypothetical protein Tco_0140521 [Tanacetum coccineum]